MRIAIVGGTGKQGTGLALRWARAGHTVSIGSRNADRARARVEELTREGTQVGANPLEGGSNTWAAAQADVVALTVPYDAHVDTLRAIEPHVAGKIVIDMTVPLKPPKVSRVNLPPGQAAALESQALLPAASVVAALHHVSSTHLADLAHTLDCDVLVAGDDARAKATVIRARARPPRARARRGRAGERHRARVADAGAHSLEQDVQERGGGHRVHRSSGRAAAAVREATFAWSVRSRPPGSR